MPPQPEKKHSLKKQTAFLFAGKLVAVVLRFMVPLLLVRMMSRQEFGLYKQALLLCFFFVPILQFGITDSILYFYPDNEKKKELISQTVYLFLLIGMAFLAAFYLFHQKLLLLFRGAGLEGVVQPASIFIFFYFITMFFEKVLILEKKNRELFAYVIADRFTYVAFILLAALIYGTVEKILWSLALYSLIKFTVVLFYLRIKYSFPVSIKKISWNRLREQLVFSVFQGGGKIVGEIGRKIDKFYLSYFLNPASFAIYSVGNFSVPVINIMCTSVATTALPRISLHYKNRRYREAKELWHRIITYYSLVTIPLVAYCWVMSEEIITFLFTEKYADSAAIFQLLLLVYLTKTLSRGTIVRASNNTRYAFQGNVLSLLWGVAAGYFLIRWRGTAGAALSVVISHYINAIYQVYKSKGILELSWREWLPWKQMGAIMIISVSMLAVIPLFKGTISTPVLLITASGLVYSALVLAGYHFAGFVNVSTLNGKLKESFVFNKQL